VIGGPARTRVSLFVALALAICRLAQAGTVVTVGASAVVVFEKPDKRATRIYTARPQTALELVAREGDWYWVVVPPDDYGVKRAGWVPVAAITDPRAASIEQGRLAGGPVLETSSTPAKVAEPQPQPTPSVSIVVVPRPSLAGTISEDRARPDVGAHGPMDADSADWRADPKAPATSGRPRPSARPSGLPVPPEPVGGEPRGQQSVMGTWFIPRSLRGSLTADYQNATGLQDPGRTDVRFVGGGGTITAAFAVLDPRIFSVDFSGELQANRATNDAGGRSYRTTTSLRNYHLAFGILSGRRFPLNVYTDRLSADNNLQPSGATLELSQRLRGVRTGSGFSWEVNDAHLPRIRLTASTSTQTDEHDYLFGNNSSNREQRAELRASRDYAAGRYDLDFTHDRFSYDVPAMGVRSGSGTDSFVAIGRLTPSSRLTLDATGRATRFTFGTGSQASSVSGGGGGGSARYRLAEKVEASGRYSFSSNVFEAALSGQFGPGQPGAAPVASGTRVATRTVFQDGEGRVEYTARQLTAAVIVKATTFGVPPGQAVTLGSLFTAGGALSVQRTVGGVTVVAGGDGSAGPARSTLGQVEPYREAGVSLGASRRVGYVTFGVDGTVRRVAHIDFYPVSLDSRSATLRAETVKPVWARVEVAATRFDSWRDVQTSDAGERHFGYRVSVRGPRYGVIAEVNQRTTIPLVLAPDLLGSQANVTGLVASRPDLIPNILAVDDRSSSFTLQLNPVTGLQLQGRSLWQERHFPGLFGYAIHNEQLWVTYHVRDVQFEFGWEYLDSASTFRNVQDRRIYVKIRRDVLFF
jgi:hypothetical protein